MSDPSGRPVAAIDHGVQERYLLHALAGATRPAVGLVMDLLDNGTREETIIRHLLAPSQHEVGERWHRNELTVADEHIATSVADSALHALANADSRAARIGDPPFGSESVSQAKPAKYPDSHIGRLAYRLGSSAPTTTGPVVVTCAVGEWHAIAARMFAEQLRARGVAVVFLGASTPAEHVAEFIGRHSPEAVAVSCSVPLHFAGVTRLVEVAHEWGVPVLAGGRALGDTPYRAQMLGADAFSQEIDQAVAALDAWRAEPPDVSGRQPSPNPDAVGLDLRADEIGAAALVLLGDRFAPMAGYDAAQLARTREDLVYIVRFAAAAALVDDPGVFSEFLEWLVSLLAARGVPDVAVTVSLDLLRPLVEPHCPTAAELIATGLRDLRER